MLVLSLFASCQSVPTEIPTDLDASQLIQKGQDAFALGNYKAAEKYFMTVLERYGTDPKKYVEAQYKIGHLYMKQKRHDKAEVVFTEILDIYQEATPGVLPGAYQKLSQIEMDKIQKKKNEVAEKAAQKKAKEEAALAKKQAKAQAKEQAALEKNAQSETKAE